MSVKHQAEDLEKSKISKALSGLLEDVQKRPFKVKDPYWEMVKPAVIEDHPDSDQNWLIIQQKVKHINSNLEGALKDFQNDVEKLNNSKESTAPQEFLKESKKIVAKYFNSVNRSMQEIEAMRDLDPDVQKIKVNVGEQFRHLSNTTQKRATEMEQASNPTKEIKDIKSWANPKTTTENFKSFLNNCSNLLRKICKKFNNKSQETRINESRALGESEARRTAGAMVHTKAEPSRIPIPAEPTPSDIQPRGKYKQN